MTNPRTTHNQAAICSNPPSFTPSKLAPFKKYPAGPMNMMNDTAVDPIIPKTIPMSGKTQASITTIMYIGIATA